MSRLLETIRVENGRPVHLDWHQKRLDKSQKLVFGRCQKIDLEREILPPPGCEFGVFKCRVLYQKQIESIDFQAYKPRKIETLKLVEAADFEYNLKWEDRRGIDFLFEKRGAADEILILKNGFLTDTSIANIALFNGKKWWTPAQPLLFGTCRARLIFEKIIFPKSIAASEIFNFQKIRIFNAMLDWAGAIELEIGGRNLFRPR